MLIKGQFEQGDVITAMEIVQWEMGKFLRLKILSSRLLESILYLA